METTSREQNSHNGEATPLLTPNPAIVKQQPAQNRTFNRVLLVLLTLATLKTLALQIFGHAQVRIFESIFCRQWYQEHPHANGRLSFRDGIEERLCKLPAIQERVNILRGHMEWWDALPGLFLTIPFGVLVDRFGRRWLFRMGVVVILLKALWTAVVCAVDLPLERIYLGSILNLFCGGHMTYEMIFFCILADITPQQKLPNVFFINNALAQTCKVVGPAITGILLRSNPWYSFLAIIPLLLIASILAFMIPETIPDHHGTDGQHNHYDDNGEQSRIKILWSTFFKAFRETAITWNDWRLICLLLLVPLRVMTNALEELVQRYVSYRFGWTLGDAAFLHSLQAIIAAFVLFLVLPSISNAMNNRDIGGIKKNKILLQSSFAMLAIAFFAQGVAPTIQFLVIGLIAETLGSGVPATLRALANVLTGQQHVGRVFSGLAAADALSIMAAFPLTATLFNAGISKGGAIWLGLPFWSTSLVMALVSMILCCLHFEPSTPVGNRSTER